MAYTESVQKSHFFLRASPLLLILFIDGMGLGLFIPILNTLILDPNSHFFTSFITPAKQNFIFGITIGIFMLCWFFGATLLGDLSDQIGRKRSLLICLVGSFISYLLSAFAVISHSIFLLIVGRIIAGFTSGSQAIAQAAIVDLSTPENKTRNIGLILFVLSLGFVLGPLLGGMLSDSNLVSWFSLTVPLYFACAVSVVNILLLIYFFQETRLMRSKAVIKPLHAINVIIEAFKHEKIKHLSPIFFIFMLGWSTFYSFISMFMLKVHYFTPTKVSLFMAAMGVGFGIGNGFLVNYVSQRFSIKNNIVSSLILGAVINLLLISFTSSWVAWFLIIPFTCCIAITYSILITAFSNQVDANSQGWIMGITGAMMALVWAVDATAVGMLATLSIYLPIIICIICLSLSAFLMSRCNLGVSQASTAVGII